jgi:hypothetical protein
MMRVKDEILQYERLVLYTLGFIVAIPLPFEAFKEVCRVVQGAIGWGT